VAAAALEGKATLVTIGELTLKGKERPQPAFELVSLAAD
jgi:hypothetical protein